MMHMPPFSRVNGPLALLAPLALAFSTPTFAQAEDAESPLEVFTNEAQAERLYIDFEDGRFSGAGYERLLEEGHALRAGDIDTVYVNGYGFPTYVGGPMWFADAQGLDNVLADMERFFEETGDEAWNPAPLLKRLVADGKNFASLDA